MEALFISFSTVTVAEMRDRTQLLSLMLVARYGRPWAILAGILFATLANHLVGTDGSNSAPSTAESIANLTCVHVS